MVSAAACRDAIDFYRRTLFSLGHSGRSSGTASHLTTGKGIFTGSKTWQKSCLIVGCKLAVRNVKLIYQVGWRKSGKLRQMSKSVPNQIEVSKQSFRSERFREESDRGRKDKRKEFRKELHSLPN